MHDIEGMFQAKEKIMIVDDEPNVIESFKFLLEDKFDIDSAGDADAAMALVRKNNYTLIILDIILPGQVDGLGLLERIKRRDQDAEVIMITATQTVENAVKAMKLGAYDYFTKPFDNDEVVMTIEKVIQKKKLEREVDFLRAEVKEVKGYGDIIGNSPLMQEVFKTMKEMEKCDTTVFIQGDSGTGKELVAQGIHYNGLRKDGPFVPVNCSAIPGDLLESELFGHEKGAFSGAVSQKKGKFELAQDGTLFLDEIPSLPMHMQSKLLRVLQEKELERVGGTKRIKVNARIISSSNIDLRRAVDQEQFRRDLYYRLNVVPVYVPPLKDRRDDLPLLINHFIAKFSRKYKKNIRGISDKALEYLQSYSWPGNVRELQNVIERIIALGAEEFITENHLPLEIVISFKDIIHKVETKQQTADVSLKDARKEFEKRMLIAFLQKYRGNQSKVSRILGVHRNTVLNKIKDFDINPTDYRRPRAPGEM